MSYSKIQICNISLAHLGANSIRSFDEKNKRARMCDVFYEATRDLLLTKFDWPFARSYRKLNEVESDLDVPPGWTVFQLPTDCRTPRDIHPPGSRTNWYVVGNHLYALNPPVYLFYTSQEVVTARFSDTFANLLALGIAVKICMPITHDKALYTSLKEDFAVEQFNSWESDANIGNFYPEHDNDPDQDTFNYPEGKVLPHLGANATEAR